MDVLSCVPPLLSGVCSNRLKRSPMSAQLTVLPAADRTLTVFDATELLCFLQTMMEIYPYSSFTLHQKGMRVNTNNSVESYTYNSFILQLEGLLVPQESLHPVFLFILFSYIFILILNVSITLLIFIDKSLHEPMYLLFCNLSTNDVLGASAVLPSLLVDMLRPPSARLIGYYECVVQAFVMHVYGTTCHTALMAMAFDRYVAICNPLRYAAVMTNRMLMKLTVSAWGVALVLVGVLLGLTVRLSRCRTFMGSMFCNNAALFQLSCENVSINNVYGLTFTAFLFTSSIGSMVLTYSKITVVCLTRQNQSTNIKALKTCSTHLLVYVIMLFSGLLVIILHRFPELASVRKMSSVLFHIIPACLNPLIYGIQSKHVRKYFTKMFQNNKVES